jgi:RNA 2',3'-cyclic 3'-phosphodiesterase
VAVFQGKPIRALRDARYRNGTMHRLFVAIRPPPEIRDRLLGLMGGIPGARWQDDGQLHLTLRFIGEVDRHQAQDIAATLGSVRQSGFEIALSGVGSFRKQAKGTLWAGVSPHDELKALHKKVDQACLRVGVAPDTRAYHPHITLARLGRRSGAVEPFIERWAGLSSQPFSVESLCLYESRLGSDGASYSIVERYPLG